MKRLLLLLAIATSVSADELTIIRGGRRIVDREPSTADSNCIGWTYGASPVTDGDGNLVAMYTVSDQLAHHCDVGIDSFARFGDAIQRHEFADGMWLAGDNVLDRASFSWMNDPSFLAEHPESFVGHLSSPSVIRADGRYYMAFVGSVDDRNLCAAEHSTTTHCGSCRDPWSYFVAMWAVSDDGVHWRVRERGPGDATLIGRAPDNADRAADSQFKGVTKVSLVAHDADGVSFFYIGAQYWTRGFIKNVMLRVERDPHSEWGIADTMEVWSENRHRWIECDGGRLPDFFSEREEYSIPSLSATISSISRTNIFGFEAFIALASVDSAMSVNMRGRANRVMYFISTNLIDWTSGYLLRSALRDFADGFGYDASVIDPVAIDDGAGTLRLFFASADGDPDHGVARDGKYDCYLDPNIGPTATYVGTGIYESTVKWMPLQQTSIVVEPERVDIAAGSSARFKVRVTSADASVPEGLVTLVVTGSPYVEQRLTNGEATFTVTVHPNAFAYAYFYTTGPWTYANATPVKLNVIAAPRRRAVTR